MRFSGCRAPIPQGRSAFDLDSGDATAVGEAPKCQPCDRFYGIITPTAANQGDAERSSWTFQRVSAAF
jgi:hypothetical protein